MLPIQTIVDTHQALSDWKFTAQEANQVIVSMWEGVMGAIMLAAAMGIFGMVVSKNPGGESSNPKRLSTSNPRIEQTTVDKIIDDLERTWHRIDSDMSIRMQEALGILKEVMSYRYEDSVVVAWDNSNLIGIAVYETIRDKDLQAQDAHISELASFTHKPGIGKLIVEKIIAIARKEGSDAVTVSYAPGSRGFYEKLGFVKDYRYPGAPTLLMYKVKSGNPHYKRPIPRNLEVLVPGDMTEEERVRRWFAYEDARIKAVEKFEDAKSEAGRDALKYLWDEATYKKALAEAEMAFHEEAEVKALEILKTPSSPGLSILSELPLPAPSTPIGTCYEDAARYVIRQEEGELVHGTAISLGRRIGHAWVELPSGYIWEPGSGEYLTKERFQELVDPIEERRYTPEEVAVMTLKTRHFGPWTEEEKKGNPGSTKLYHCTALENVSGIMKRGLLSFESEMLFFFPDLGVAEESGLSGMAILEVSITDDEVDKCIIGETFPELYSERYGGEPPADVTLREYIRNPVAYGIPEVCCTIDEIPADRIKYLKTIRR